MKPTDAAKEWTLSKPLTNQIISDEIRRGLTGTMPIYGIDVPEDSSDRIHFAGVVVFGDEQRAKDIIAAINERERLREALQLILKEAEFVGDAKQPFSTWVAENCRAALNGGQG